MTRQLVRFIALLAFLATVATTFVEAHPNHKIMGTVSMVAADHIMVKDRDAKEHTIKLTKATKVTRARKPFKAADIPVGARVVATVVSHSDLTARIIEVGVVRAAK